MHQPHFVSRRAFGVLAAVAALALLIAPATFTASAGVSSSTIIFQEDFETAGDGTRYFLTKGDGTVTNEFSDLVADFAIRVEGSTLGTEASGIDLGYNGLDGWGGDWFFAAQDVDGETEGNPAPVNLTTTAIDTTGFTNLQLGILWAEDPPEGWNETQQVDVQYSTDGTNFITLYCLVGQGTAVPGDSAPFFDIGCDGTLEVTSVDRDFANFGVMVPDADSITLRVAFNITTGSADISLDDITLTGTSTGQVVTLDLSDGAFNEDGTGTLPSITVDTNDDAVTEEPISVDVADSTAGLLGDLAEAGDYTLNTTTVNIPAGTDDGAVIPLDITVTDDANVEASEVVNFTLSNPMDANIAMGGDTGLLLIGDDDVATIDFASESGTVAEGDGTYSVDAVLTLPTGGALETDAFISVFVDGEEMITPLALDSNDYTLDTNLVTFVSGATDQATQPVQVTITDDVNVEADEVLTLVFVESLVSETAITAQDAAPGTINQHAITITSEDVATISLVTDMGSVMEGMGADVQATFDLPDGGVLETNLQGTLAVTDGTATVTEDYAFGGGTTFLIDSASAPADGDTITLGSFTTTDDSDFEGDETFDVAINPPAMNQEWVTGATTAQTWTIQDNDEAPTAVTLSLDGETGTVSEDGTTYTTNVVLNVTGGNTTEEITVAITAADGTADSSDYTLSTTSVTFPTDTADGTTQSVEVAITDDVNVEGDQTFTLSLGMITGTATAVAPTTQTVTITDNDNATVSLVTDMGSVMEGMGADVQVTLDLPDGGVLERDLSGSITVTDGTATQGVDYSFNGTNFTVPAASNPMDGAVLTIASFTTTDDADVEGDETFMVMVNAPALEDGWVAGTTTSQTWTITDNDGVPPAGLVTNGDFANNLDSWVAFNLNGDASTGVAELTRNDTLDNGILAQNLNTGGAIPANTSYDVSIDLGNTSNQSKYVTLLLWELNNFNNFGICFFTVPANTPLATYTLQTNVGPTGWNEADLWLFIDDFSNPSLQVDNVSVTPSQTPVTQTNCGAPLVDNGNMVVNGGFDIVPGFEDAFYFFSDATTRQVTNNVLEMTRGTLFDPFGTPQIGLLAQTTRFAPPANTQYQASVQMGNTSDEAKLVRLDVLATGVEASRQVCLFVVPPSTSLQTYTLQAVTPGDWFATDVVLFVEDFAEEWLQVDDVNLSFQQGQSVSEVTCTTPLVDERNLLLNGDFEYGNIFFGTFGTIITDVAPGFTDFFLRATTNTPDRTDVGAIFQPVFFDAPAGSAFEVSVILENPTAETKGVALQLYNFDDPSDALFCFFELPPFTPAAQYVMQGVAQNNWTNTSFEFFLEDGAPVLFIDDFSVQSRPNDGITGLSCPLVGAASTDVQAFPAAAAAEVAPAEVEVEAVTLDVAPIAPEVAAPEVTEEAPAPVVVTEEAPAPAVEESAPAVAVTEEAPAPAAEAPVAEEPVAEEPAPEEAPVETEPAAVVEEAAPVEEPAVVEEEPAAEGESTE